MEPSTRETLAPLHIRRKFFTTTLAAAQNVQCRYCGYECEWFPKSYEMDDDELTMMPDDGHCPYGPEMPGGGTL